MTVARVACSDYVMGSFFRNGWHLCREIRKSIPNEGELLDVIKIEGGYELLFTVPDDFMFPLSGTNFVLPQSVTPDCHHCYCGEVDTLHRRCCKCNTLILSNDYRTVETYCNIADEVS